VGKPTVQAILGTMIAPGLLDGMMARRAWDGQMTKEPAPRRPDNLFEPVPRSPEEPSRFADSTESHAVLASASLVRGAIGVAGLALVVGFAAFARSRTSSRMPANATNRTPASLAEQNTAE
jgi:hypothetical protein